MLRWPPAADACQGAVMSFLSTAVQTSWSRVPSAPSRPRRPTGPHCTPLVFAYSGGRLWFTTSRRSVKTRAWKADPSAAGLVRQEDLAVAFTGTAKLYDALDRNTWGDAVAGATSIARATVAFSRKNARFFAGYAIDAEAGALRLGTAGSGLRRHRACTHGPGRRRRGAGGGRAAGRERRRRTAPSGGRRQGPRPARRVPARRATPPRRGRGRGPDADRRPRPRRGSGEMAGRRARTLRRTPRRDPRARARGSRRPRGAHRGRGIVVARPGHGGRDAARHGVDLSARRTRERGQDRPWLATEIDPDAGALVRLAPSRAVWWRGWSSGSADVA